MLIIIIIFSLMVLSPLCFCTFIIAQKRLVVKPLLLQNTLFLCLRFAEPCQSQPVFSCRQHTFARWWVRTFFDRCQTRTWDDRLRAGCFPSLEWFLLLGILPCSPAWSAEWVRCLWSGEWDWSARFHSNHIHHTCRLLEYVRHSWDSSP